METVNLEGLSPVVDLSGVEGAKRAALWTGTATAVFPGLSIQAIEANPAIADDPSVINSDPEGDGWFFKLRLSDEGRRHEPRRR